MKIFRRLLPALLLLLSLPANALAAYECWTKPNAAAAAFPAQARLYEQDFQALALGVRGTGVIYAAGACQVAAQGSPNNTVAVANGCVIAVAGSTATVTSGNVTVAAANATNPRFTLVGATSAGVKSAIDGTPAASPLPPTIPDNYVPFAWVYVPANDNIVNAAQITDARPCIPTPGGGGGAPTTAKYWTEGSEAGLSAERNMSLLATGLIQNNTGTGIPTTLAPTDDNIVVGNGSTWQLKALPTCSGGTNALIYNISTNAFGCNTIAGGGTVTTTSSPAAPQVALMSGATSITGVAGLTYDVTNGLVSTGSASGGTHEVADALTSAVVPALRLKHTTSGAMASSGFGVCQQFVTRDNTAADNIVGQVCATSSGADNTGRIGIATPIAGSLAERMVIDAAGAVTVTNLAGAGTQCVQVSSAGVLSGTGASCGVGSGPTITTFSTSPTPDVTAPVTINSLTLRTVHHFFLPGATTLNLLSLSPDTVTTNGALKKCIYSADGATKLVDVTSGTPVTNTPLSTAVGSIVLPAGEYYAVEGCAFACNLVVRGVPAETGSALLFGANSPAGKKKWHGTVTHTSGTCNTTLGTITGTATAYPILRGDF